MWAAGEHFAFERRIGVADLDDFARLTGDVNPLHMDEEHAARTSLKKRVVHGMLVAGMASKLVGMHIPGRGALWAEQRLEFRTPAHIGDLLRFEIEVLHYSESAEALKIRLTVINQHRRIVLIGDGVVSIVKEREESMAPGCCKVAFVAGGSGGIGRAVALRLGAAGVAVGINYRSSQSSAQDIASRIVKDGGRAVAVQADVCDIGEVQAAIGQCAERLGAPVDLLVCSVGSPIVSRNVTELEWEDFSQHLDTQVKGSWHCVKAALPSMIDNGFGRIVLVGSTVTWGLPPGGWAHYVTAKSALAGFMKALAVELGPKGIQVNSVCPGMTDTEFWTALPELSKKMAAAQIPLRRLGTPEDIAAVVGFLATPEAGYLHGIELPISGGSVMR